jgi:hypothetical protein
METVVAKDSYAYIARLGPYLVRPGVGAPSSCHAALSIWTEQVVPPAADASIHWLTCAAAGARRARPPVERAA